MSGLRFAFLTTFYPPHNFGGDGIAVERLARGLVRAGHRVTVIHDADAYRALGGPEPAPRAAAPGVEVVTLRTRWPRLSTLLTQQLGRPVLNRGPLRRLLEAGAYDVINFHNVSLLGGPGLLALGSGLKLYLAHEHWLVCPTHVLWRHGREACPGRQCLRCQLRARRPPQLWRYTGTLTRALRQVDAFIALSEFSRAKHAEFGFPREMEVLPDLLEDSPLPDRPQPAPHPRPYVLFAGRLERIKGLDDVLPLFREGQGPDLLIAGEGSHGGALRRQAAGAERIRFLGPVEADDLARLYRGALAVIVPSVCYETFGMVVIEAFRAGVPVVARRIGPLPELLESGGGELFSTPAELAAALSRLTGDRDYRARLGAAGRAAFEARWREEVVVARYLDLVRAVAQRKGADGVVRRLGGDPDGSVPPSLGRPVARAARRSAAPGTTGIPLLVRGS